MSKTSQDQLEYTKNFCKSRAKIQKLPVDKYAVNLKGNSQKRKIHKTASM